MTTSVHADQVGNIVTMTTYVFWLDEFSKSISEGRR